MMALRLAVVVDSASIRLQTPKSSGPGWRSLDCMGAWKKTPASNDLTTKLCIEKFEYVVLAVDRGAVLLPPPLPL